MEFKTLLGIGLGATAIIWPDLFSKRIARRIAEGDDRYLDEQRSYRAYPYLNRRGFWRGAGAVILLLSIGMLISE